MNKMITRNFRLSRGTSPWLARAACASLALALTACGAAGSESEGSAVDNFPERSIELIVPFGAGGSSDSEARAAASIVEKELGESIAVVNVEGGGGIVGTRQVMNAKSDGYTIALTAPTLFSLSPHIVENYDMKLADEDETSPLVGLATEPLLIVAKRGTEFDSLEGLVSAGEQGKRIRYGHTGVGGTTHYSLAAFFAEAGIDATGVPFDGGAETVTALLGENVDVIAAHPNYTNEHVESGDLVFLGIFSPERASGLPDVPTMVEQGYEVQIEQWKYLFAPAGTPEGVVEILTDAFSEAIETPEYKGFLENNKIEPNGLVGEEISEAIEDEYKRYGEMADAAGLKVAGSE